MANKTGGLGFLSNKSNNFVLSLSLASVNLVSNSGLIVSGALMDVLQPGNIRAIGLQIVAKGNHETISVCTFEIPIHLKSLTATFQPSIDIGAVRCGELQSQCGHWTGIVSSDIDQLSPADLATTGASGIVEGLFLYFKKGDNDWISLTLFVTLKTLLIKSIRQNISFQQGEISHKCTLCTDCTALAWHKVLAELGNSVSSLVQSPSLHVLLRILTTFWVFVQKYEKGSFKKKFLDKSYFVIY